MKNSSHDFNHFIANNLNLAQKKAVEHDAGPLLVIAGAGSGKTRIITARITHLLLNKHVDPRSIIALTFTNKAAREMLERIEKFLDGTRIPTPIIGTFHSYCLRMLKRFAHLHDIPDFAILDEDDQLKMLSIIIDRIDNHGQKTSVRDLVFQISQYKNETAVGNVYTSNNEYLTDIVRLYEKEKKQSRCYDFDDLLLHMLKLFQNNQEFKKQFQQEIEHILVDEYQDTNHVQHALLKEMALNEKKLGITSVCVVGDEDQSIYSWRGATIDNILQFQHDFQNTTSITIEQNYRSVQPILEIANHVIDHNVERNPKKLWSVKKGSNRISLLTCTSSYQESDLIAQCIQHAQQKFTDQPIAVLYRTHYQSRVIEEALLRHSIGYRIIGGIQFYERKEIKDIIAYLRLITNPYDRISFKRALHCPPRGLGNKFYEQFIETWDSEPLLNLMQVGKKLIDDKVVVKTKKDALNNFLNLFASFTEADQPTRIIEKILLQTEYIPFLKRNYQQQEAEEKTENIREFIRAVTHFEQIGITNLRTLLEEITLMQEKTARSNKDEQQTNVQLMTLHAAKGLEFATVIIAGLEEGLLPSSRARFDSKQLEEERRLFYVGITRTQEYLLLTNSKFRSTYGTMNDQIPSRFIDEIPRRLYQEHECTTWQSYHGEQFFAQWFNLTARASAPEVFTFGIAHEASMQTSKQKKGVSKKVQRKFASLAASFETGRIKNDPSVIKIYGRSSGPWRINQPVKHAKFGIGIIKKVESKGNDNSTITVQFKSGTKKISSSFLEVV